MLIGPVSTGPLIFPARVFRAQQAVVNFVPGFASAGQGPNSQRLSSFEKTGNPFEIFQSSAGFLGLNPYLCRPKFQNRYGQSLSGYR
jgi:hypothetical protein